MTSFKTTGVKRRSLLGLHATFIGERMTLKVANIIQHYGHSIVTEHVDGLFDKRGLADPLVLAVYFSSHDGEIVQLIIRRNQPGT
jgi:hypothetical protein